MAAAGLHELSSWLIGSKFGNLGDEDLGRCRIAELGDELHA